MNKKYIIKLNSSPDRYIRHADNFSKIDGDQVYAMAKITPKKSLIKPAFLFDTQAEAEIVVRKLENKLQKCIPLALKKLATYSKPTVYRWASILKKGFIIEEYTPTFEFNKKRKTHNKSWVTNDVTKYCHICGSNIPYGTFLRIGLYNICPFCLKKIGEESNKWINEQKIINPLIEEDHMVEIFTGSL